MCIVHGILSDTQIIMEYICFRTSLCGNRGDWLMLFSFIIPVYNCCKYIENCVDSILEIKGNNKLFNIELLLIDDGSTDGSGFLCDQILDKNRDINMVRVFHQKNQGVSVARNRGIDEAKGDYIVFIDADDTVEAKGFADLLEIIAEDGGLDAAIYGITFDYYHNGNKYHSNTLVPPYQGKVPKREWERHYLDLFVANCLSALWNKVIKRSLVIDNKLELRENMFLYEDLEFSLRVMHCAENVFFAKESLYHYNHQNNNRITDRIGRLDHIDDLVAQIADALIKSEDESSEIAQQKKEILLMIYIYLAREKNKTSPMDEIVNICKEFREWIDTYELYEGVKEDSYALKMYRGEVKRIVFIQTYYKIRHKIAAIVKRKIGVI